MNRKHALTISLAAALAAIAGTVAATKSVHLGHSAAASTTQSASSVVAQRSAALDRIEVSLRKALAQKPPKLPPLPQKVSGGGARRSATSADGAARDLRQAGSASS